MSQEIQSVTNIWDAIQVIGTATAPALITYFITKNNNEKEIIKIEQQHKNEITKLENIYNHDTKKYKLDKKMEILNTLTIESEKFFSSYMDIYSLFYHTKGTADKKEKDFFELSNEHIEEFNEKEQSYQNAIRLSDSIRAKLCLLGLKLLTKF